MKGGDTNPDNMGSTETNGVSVVMSPPLDYYLELVSKGCVALNYNVYTKSQQGFEKGLCCGKKEKRNHPWQFT